MGSILQLEDAYSTPTRVYWDKTTHADKPDALAMRIGRHFELLVLELFAEQHPELVVTGGGLYVSSFRHWQAATFDALAYGQTSQPIPVQAKTTYTFDPEHWGEPPDGDIPGPYHAQMLQEIDVADAPYGWLPVLPTGRRGALRVYRVERDETELDFMREVGEQFHTWLCDGTPPPVDWRPETTQALKRMYPATVGVDAVVPKSLGRRARAARAALRLAERRWGLVENQLRERMGNATRAVTADDDVIATRSTYDQRHIKADALRAAHPGIAAEFTAATPVDKILIKQPKVTQ